MTHSRRGILRKASALSALAVGASLTASAADCSGVPEWDPNTSYGGGDQVTYDGDLFTAEWWNHGNEPDGSKAVWTNEGACNGGGGGNTAPTASFTTSISTPDPGEDVTFDASGSSDPDGSISSYNWDFGDGSSGSGQSVTHSYGSSGDYTVTLTVTDDAGATDTDSTTVSVSDGGGGNQAPDASFTVSPSSPTAGESATFDGAGSSDPDGSISSYSWDLGDGSSATGQSVSHTYSSSGDYTVTLTVTDDDGATDSNATTVTVQESGGGGGANCDGVQQYQSSATYTGGDQVIHDGQLWTAEWWTSGTEPAESENVWTLEGNCGNFSPTAIATASPPNPAVGETVTFDGSSSSDQDGSITSYDWDFGDGASASGETVTHSYGSEGDVTATLAVTDDAGATGSDTVTVGVGDSGGGGTEGQLFAPYQGTWGNVPNATLNASTDRVVLSFVGDGTSGDGVNPGWLTSGGQRPLSDFAGDVQTLQDNGVDVWVAMGGWHGRTIAADATNATEVKEAYEQVIDTLGVTHIDIDDENAQAAHRDGTVYQLRNEGLAMLQSERPEVEISYTVPAGSGGIENRNYAPARDMVSDAVAQGVDLSYVNIMTMGHGGDYGTFISSATQGTVDWLANPYPGKSEAERWQMLGVTPNVGESNFGTSDGQWLVDFAEQNGMGLLSFWAMYKSSANSQADVFYQFEDGGD